MTVIELCIDDVAGVHIATEAGVNRVELCVHLEVGGLTPPVGLVEEALTVAPAGGLQVLIREQSESFVLGSTEVDRLAAVMDEFAALPTGGVRLGFVVGAITADGRIDLAAAKVLREAAGDAPLTFHRAFDLVEDQTLAVRQLIDLGYDRVLTTGGHSTVAQVEGLRSLAEAAGGSLVILGSGGLRSHNVAEVVAAAGLGEVHMRAPGENGGTSPDEVQRITRALRGGLSA